MTWLSLLLIFKIAFTAIAAALPLLFLPAKKVAATLGVAESAAPLARLYGMALIALLVGYASGVPVAEEARMPWGVVAMGIVSNTGATSLLLTTGMAKRSPFSAPVFGAIAVLLAAATFAPTVALSRAW